MNVALIITAAIVILAFILGMLSGRKVKMNLEQWSVGGRNFGTLLLWLLMAGEIYTTFTFLGASGYAYLNGGPVFYILGYGALAYAVSYFLLPPIWRYAKEHGLITQSDYFVKRFQSPWLGVLTAVVGVAFMIPYTELQLAGLGTIIQISTGEAIPTSWSLIIASVLTAVFVYASGLRSTAWISVLKDILMIVVVLIIGIGLPLYYFGSFGNMFAAVHQAHPHFLSLPGGSKNLGIGWFITTLILTSLGFFMWPHAFGAVYSSKSERAIQKNAIFLPIYQILLMLIFFVGFTALLIVPGLKGSASNGALLVLSVKAEPSWLVGLIGGAGALTAMVPASLILLQAATLVSRNIYQAVIRPEASEETVHLLARILVLVLTAVTLYFALFAPNLIVNLLLTGYDGVTQFFPAVAMSLLWPQRTNKIGAASGIIVGVGLVMILLLTNHDPLWGVNAGFIALVANIVVTVVVSLATTRAASPAIALQEQGQD
ncbi:sodium:solute symporter family protein [Ktedonosporobacter rubrisoli]|uniref:Sodium:solute symporter family protein n=1 Tax=Ktedonosporobacter rubrisoli TaxID=2509675 RepID=A0A4P6K4D8_KTERU|nr:sodium:solute symporter family protein [Ktedonosporobacter rubrisoli]QBD83089.1 sodium:solute symporter family protein [Ktedonosporobacter rubrisoli]